jgi:predicted acylesterase/phospholipase RssA
LSSYSDADVDRIARHIAGCGVGVILAGGGGHGLAHLGALKALEDEGVPVDVIGGASQGTLTAALYARTANSSVVSARVKKLASLIASPRRLLTDLTPPFLSILTGETIDKSIRDMFGDKMEIEDLWIPFFCCATNLTTGKLISCTSGSVWRYARASTSVLGFLPPIADEITGDLLVDGAYLNPVPVDVLRKLSRVESTIVVDVEDEHYAAFRSLTARDGGLGGWRLLWERVSPFAHADKLWQSIKSGKGGSKSSSESFKEYSTSSSSESESNSSSSDDKERNEEGSTARRKEKSTEMKNKKKSVATTNAAPSYATLLGALLRATSRREVAEAAKSCEIDVYLRPPGVPPFTFHTGLTDKRTDDLIRRARFKAAGVIRKWQQIKFNAIKDNMENTPLQATSYYGFYSSTMQNSQGTLSAIQPNMPPSPRGGGQGGGGGAGMHTITPFHAQQTPPSYPSSSPISTDSPRGGRHRRASFEDIDGERDSGVAIVSEQAFIVKKEEQLEQEQTKIVRKITPARRIVDSKTIVVDAKAALKKSSSSKLDCV